MSDRLLAAKQYGVSAIVARRRGAAYDRMASELVTLAGLADNDAGTTQGCLRAAHEARGRADRDWATFERCVLMAVKLAKRASRE